MQTKNQAKKQTRVRRENQLKSLLKSRDKAIKAGRTLSHDEVWKHL